MAERKKGKLDHETMFVALIEQQEALFKTYMNHWLENGSITIEQAALYKEEFDEYINTLNETYLELKGDFSFMAADKKVPKNKWLMILLEHTMIWKSMNEPDPTIH